MTEQERTQIERKEDDLRSAGNDIWIKYRDKSPSAAEALKVAFDGFADWLERFRRKASNE